MSTTSSQGWIGCDLDGTLAIHITASDPTIIGEPVPLMLARVKQWLAEGIEVRIMTARVGPHGDDRYAILAREAIKKWCVKWVGQELAVTACKDFQMVQLWDDRAVQVEVNTGRRADGQP